MRLVALGDSFTCGEGVGVRVPALQTWTALLAQSLGADHTSYAGPGARVQDVLTRQVPRVEDADVATVLVGLNDVARGGFDVAAVTEDLTAIVAGLRERVPTVVVGRLHDPTRFLWFPPPLRRIGQVRVAALNAAVDGLEGVHVLDTEAIEAWHRPGGWDVDRVHPSRAGHAALAHAAAGVLADAGWDVAAEEICPLPRGAGLVRRGVWGARHGMPYVAGHLRELGAPAWEALTAATGARPAHQP